MTSQSLGHLAAILKRNCPTHIFHPLGGRSPAHNVLQQECTMWLFGFQRGEPGPIGAKK